MMSLSASITEHLVGTAAIAAITTRVFHMHMGSVDTLPYIVHQGADGEHVQHQTGISGLAFDDRQIDIYADIETGAESLKDAVRIALSGFTGTMGTVNTTIIDGIVLQPSPEIWETPVHAEEQGLHRVTMNFDIWYRESTS